MLEYFASTVAEKNAHPPLALILTSASVVFCMVMTILIWIVPLWICSSVGSMPNANALPLIVVFVLEESPAFV